MLAGCTGPVLSKAFPLWGEAGGAGSSGETSGTFPVVDRHGQWTVGAVIRCHIFYLVIPLCYSHMQRVLSVTA